MTVTTVFSSASALLSSDIISKYSGSDLDALLTTLRRHSGIQIIRNTESISIAGKWTSVLEAHAILRDSISKAKSIFDVDISKLNERNEIIKAVSNAKEGYRSTTWSEDEISNILELQKPENEQALEDEMESQVPTGYTAEDFRSRNANSIPRSEEYSCDLKDTDRSIKSIEKETSLEKQKKDIILDHTYFKYSNDCEKYNAVTGDVITSDYINAGLVIENLAKENTQSAIFDDENDQMLYHQTQTERTATVMGSAVKDPVPTLTQVSASKTSLLNSGSHTQNTNEIDIINKNQKKSSARSETFERPSNTSFEEIQTINDSGTFRSGVCGFFDESKSQIKQQRVKQDGIRLKYDKRFDSKSDLQQHRKHEHNFLRVHKNSEWKSIPNTVGTFPCLKCDYVGKSRDRIREHWIRAHCRRFKCNDCGKFFGQNTELKRHRQTVHVPARVCKYCDKSYKTKTGYKMHLAYQHGDGVSHLYTCDTCNKRFTSMKNIASHTEKDHLGIIPVGTILCHVCGKKFRRKQSYDIHMDVHSDVKLYQCDTCKKRFSTKQGYQEHIVIHTDRVKHKCEICGKAYFAKKYLQLHKNASHGEGQLRSFQCEICDKICISNYRLRMHQKIHAKSRDHVCTICGKDFTQVTSLQRHQRIHSDDKPYSCSFCRKTSTDVSVIRRHVMLVHKKDPETWQEAVEKSVKLKK